MFGRRLSHAGHSHHVGHPHPLRRRVLLTILVAALLAALALLISPPHAHGNFVYWANGTTPGSIGRAKINGTGANNNFITGLDQPYGRRRRLEVHLLERGRRTGSGAPIWTAPASIRTSSPPDVTNRLCGIAVTANSGIYWVNHIAGDDTIGHANIDGSNPVGSFFDTGSDLTCCGLAADQSFVYWLNTSGGPVAIGRALLSGAGPDPNFITGRRAPVAASRSTRSFLYWDASGNSIGRAPVGGGSARQRVHSRRCRQVTSVRRRSEFAIRLLGQSRGLTGSNFVGRANINGNAPNPALIAGAGQPCCVSRRPPRTRSRSTRSRKRRRRARRRSTPRCPAPGRSP